MESLAIAVAPERLWEALTSPGLLGELVLGKVKMGTRPGQEFCWEWGEWKRAAPGKGSHSWSGTVLDAVPGSTLVLGGTHEVVTLTVKGAGESALVTVTHVPMRAVPSEDYQYGWADFLLRLKTRLEAIPAEDAIFLRTLLRARPAGVLSAWLSPKAMSAILPGRAKIQPRVGGSFQWQWREGAIPEATGTFREIVKGHRLNFSWRAQGGESSVVLSAEATPYGTLVSLEHRGIPPGRERDSTSRMWARLLERMRIYFYFGRKIRR